MLQTKTDSAIKRVHVFSTGSAEQHKEHRYGSRLPVMWWLLTSRSWIEVPINAFVLEHRDGLVLFDTGMNPAIGSDPGYINSAIAKIRALKEQLPDLVLLTAHDPKATDALRQAA